MKSFKVLSICFTALLFITSCEKEENGMDEMKDKAKIIFINTAPWNKTDSVAKHAYCQTYYNSAAPFAYGLRAGTYSGYRAINPGNVEVKFETYSLAGGAANGQPLVLSTVATKKNFSISTDADSYYTLFATDSVEAPDQLLVKDDLSLPTNGKVKFRVFNMSVNLNNIELINNSNGQLIYPNRIARKQTAPFVEIDPIDISTMRVKDVATGTLFNPGRVNGTARLLFEANNIYTLYIYGNTTKGGNSALQFDYVANRFKFVY